VDLPISFSGTLNDVRGTSPHLARSGNSTALAIVAGGAAVMLGAVALSRKDDGRSNGAAAAQASMGLVFIMTEPADALVTWNGHPLGKTPGMFELPPGEHTLLLTKDDYQMEPVIVTVAPPAGEKPNIASKAVFLRRDR
jgi:hypothetical protein